MDLELPKKLKRYRESEEYRQVLLSKAEAFAKERGMDEDTYQHFITFITNKHYLNG